MELGPTLGFLMVSFRLSEQLGPPYDLNLHSRDLGSGAGQAKTPQPRSPTAHWHQGILSSEIVKSTGPLHSWGN